MHVLGRAHTVHWFGVVIDTQHTIAFVLLFVRTAKRTDTGRKELTRNSYREYFDPFLNDNRR